MESLPGGSLFPSSPLGVSRVTCGPVDAKVDKQGPTIEAKWRLLFEQGLAQSSRTWPGLFGVSYGTVSQVNRT